MILLEIPQSKLEKELAKMAEGPGEYSQGVRDVLTWLLFDTPPPSEILDDL